MTPTKTPHPCSCLTADPDDPTTLHARCPRTTRREFAPGHDATTKATLIRAHRAGGTVTLVGLLGERIETTALAIAATRGWERFLTDAPAKAETKTARRAAEATRASDEAASWSWSQISLAPVSERRASRKASAS